MAREGGQKMRSFRVEMAPSEEEAGRRCWLKRAPSGERYGQSLVKVREKSNGEVESGREDHLWPNMDTWEGISREANDGKESWALGDMARIWPFWYICMIDFKKDV